MPNERFAATKIFAGASYGAAKSFRSGEPFSQPKGNFAGGFVGHSAAAKWGWGATKWHSCAKGVFRSYENFRSEIILQRMVVFAAKAQFRKGSLLAAK